MPVVLSKPISNYETIKQMLGDALSASGINLPSGKNLSSVIDRIHVEYDRSGIPLLVFCFDGSDADAMVELATAFRRNTHNIHVILQLEKQFSPSTGEKGDKPFHELFEEANQEETFKDKCVKFKYLSEKSNLGFEYRTNENPWLAIALTILVINIIKEQEGYTKTLTFTYLTEEGCATETSPRLEEAGKLIYNEINPFGFIWQCFMKPILEGVLKHYVGSYSEDITDFNHVGIQTLMTDLQKMMIQYPSIIPDDHSVVYIHVSGPASFTFSNKELVAFLMKQRERTVCSIMGFTELHLEIQTLQSAALIRDPTATINQLLHPYGFAEFIGQCLLNNVQLLVTTNNAVNDKSTGGANYTQDPYGSSTEFMEGVMPQYGITSRMMMYIGVKFYGLSIKRKLFDPQSLLNFLSSWDLSNKTLEKAVFYFLAQSGSSILIKDGESEVHPSFHGLYERTINNPTISGECYVYAKTNWLEQHRTFLAGKDKQEAMSEKP